jgi:adenylyltransferase/sulfurtransferase
MDDSQLRRYSRHILLDDLGINGQRRLANARALIVGAGGLGCPAALYLAAAGVGEIAICDDDKVDLTNLQRQILYPAAAVGADKTSAAGKTLRAMNPEIKIREISSRLAEENAAALIKNADVVLDGSDNYATRHLVNRACRAAARPLVSGAALGFDGQVAVFGTSADSPCYNCLFGEDDDAPQARCALMGVFAPLAGIVGCIQAAEAIKIIAAPQLPTLGGRLLLIDARMMRIREVKLPQDPRCAVCAGR